MKDKKSLELQSPYNPKQAPKQQPAGPRAAESAPKDTPEGPRRLVPGASEL